MSAGWKPISLLIALLAFLTCSCKPKPHGMLQLAAEATVGHYYRHRQLPTQEQVREILKRDNNEELDPGDRLFYRLIHRDGDRSAPMIEMKIVSPDGSELTSLHDIDESLFDPPSTTAP